ncbi:GNAT family N-acetyltransferase [Streptomyces antarcticus]|uniref:GNAT family N-acetyltransferase n=1 Tax=Streptomyces antarcticus TaxID=2996458 RepID=UPI0022B05A7A|nr:GNAT family N-acetyltransferase [Streptomyces sp. H34-S5]MCZ4085460.1 GNAT family N-acetyltransferase [Streptomyces sp. H34-S5]
MSIKHTPSHEPAWVGALRERLADYPAKIHISHDGTTGRLALDLLVVTRSQRNKGVGTAIMRALASEADRHDVQIALTPVADFGGSVTRLRTFYRRFGFISNQGRGKDYSTKHTMLRRPVDPSAKFPTLRKLLTL